MPFTRDSLAAYEKQPQTSTTDNSVARAFGKPAADPASPAATPPATPAPEASSAPAASDPAVPADASSADTAAPATAPAEPEGSAVETPVVSDPAAPEGRTIPYSRFQEVIDERNALKKYGDLLLERLEAAKQTQPPAATPAAAAAPVVSEEVGPMPTLASVAFDEAVYQQKMMEWNRKVARAEARAELQAHTAQQTTQQRLATYVERESAFAKENPTFKEVTANKLPQFAPDTAATILENPKGPAVVFYLGKNPDEGVRLARMSPAQQLVRLGQIISEVAAPASAPASTQKKPVTPTTRTVTQAPPPPRPTPGGSAPSPTGMPPRMDDFVAQERAKTIAQREQRAQMRRAMK